MKKLPIYETFHTFQGEGVHTGRRAFFIRTMGCPVKCPWCDSAGTWHPDYRPPELHWKTVSELVAAAKASGAGIAVVTGGEPTIHDLTDLCNGLRSEGIQVHLETSGAFPLKGEFDWITVSPKKYATPLEEVLWMADEIKVIVSEPSDLDYYVQVLLDARLPRPFKFPVWLHPEWSQRTNPEVLRAISRWVLSEPGDFRAGWQVHKLYSVDPEVLGKIPLGGDPKKGY